MRSRRCALAFSTTLFLAFARAQDATTLPPWLFQTMYWGWNSDQNNTWTQCRGLEIQWWQIPDTTPAIKGPYKATFYLAGHEPYVVNLGQGTPNGKVLTYDWQVVLPSGGPYQGSLTDANGATAGVCNEPDTVLLVTDDRRRTSNGSTSSAKALR